jgi:hypothetical protein
LIWQGAACCPKGIISNTAITTPVPCSPWHDASHLGFGGPELCLPSMDVTPLCDKDTKGWILERTFHTKTLSRLDTSLAVPITTTTVQLPCAHLACYFYVEERDTETGQGYMRAFSFFLLLPAVSWWFQVCTHIAIWATRMLGDIIQGWLEYVSS